MSRKIAGTTERGEMHDGQSECWGYRLGVGVGRLDWVGLNGVGFEPNPDHAPTIPHQAFMICQAVFAVITPALITGAFAERKRFKAFVLFSLLWVTVVYDPVTHWVWGHGGILHELGAVDFAGGIVMHVSSGASVGGGADAGPSPGLRPGAHGSTRCDHDDPWRRPAVVRVVRLQRGQRPRGERGCGERLRRDQHRRGHGRADLDDGKLGPPTAAERARRGCRCRGRFGHHQLPADGWPGTRSTATLTAPPSGVWARALESRFWSTCPTRSGSISTGVDPSASSWRSSTSRLRWIASS